MKKSEKKDNRFYTRLNRLNQRVEWLILEGNFHRGIRLLKRIIQITAKRGKKTHQGLAAYRLASLYLEVFAYQFAITYFKLALKCLDYPGTPMTRTVSEIYKGLYECYTRLEQPEKALKYATLICEYAGLSPLERAFISRQIAQQLLKQYEADGKITHVIRGLTYAKDALKLYEAENQMTKDYVLSLLTCGDIYFFLREYDQALVYLNKAYEHAGIAEVDRTLLGQICYLMSRVYALKGEQEQALFYRNRCLEFA